MVGHFAEDDDLDGLAVALLSDERLREEVAEHGDAVHAALLEPLVGVPAKAELLDPAGGAGASGALARVAGGHVEGPSAGGGLAAPQEGVDALGAHVVELFAVVVVRVDVLSGALEEEVAQFGVEAVVVGGGGEGARMGADVIDEAVEGIGGQFAEAVHLVVLDGGQEEFGDAGQPFGGVGVGRASGAEAELVVAGIPREAREGLHGEARRLRRHGLPGDLVSPGDRQFAPVGVVDVAVARHVGAADEAVAGAVRQGVMPELDVGDGDVEAGDGDALPPVGRQVDLQVVLALVGAELAVPLADVEGEHLRREADLRGRLDLADQDDLRHGALRDVHHGLVAKRRVVLRVAAAPVAGVRPVPRVQQGEVAELGDALGEGLGVIVGGRVVPDAVPAPDLHAVLVADADGLLQRVVGAQRVAQAHALGGGVEVLAALVLRGDLARPQRHAAHVHAQIDLPDAVPGHLLHALLPDLHRIDVSGSLLVVEDVVEVVDGGAHERLAGTVGGEHGEGEEGGAQRQQETRLRHGDLL